MAVIEEPDGPAAARATSLPLHEASGEGPSSASLAKAAMFRFESAEALLANALRGLPVVLFLENCSRARLSESTVRSSFWILELSDFRPRLWLL